MNPNNCDTCLHKLFPDGGWCYMFRDEPRTVCMQHTGRAASSQEVADDGRELLREARDLEKRLEDALLQLTGSQRDRK